MTYGLSDGISDKKTAENPAEGQLSELFTAPVDKLSPQRSCTDKVITNTISLTVCLLFVHQFKFNKNRILQTLARS
jgi:hypothetical protein